MRRASGWTRPTLECGPVVLDTTAQTVAVGGQGVELTSYEYKVPSNGSIVPCTTLNEVRIYRQNPQAAWTNATGLGRKVLAGCGAPGR